MTMEKLQSFARNYFRFETSYFTVGGWRQNLRYFLKLGNVRAHVVDRVKFRIYPKLDIVARFPSHLDIETASACQMRCPMCYTTFMPDHLKGIMKWDLYTKLVDQAVELGVYSIKLSWRGEPFLNKRVVEMVRYAKTAGIREVAFLTNAELLTAEHARGLVDAGLDWLSISADGVGKIYNEIRAPAIFEETVEKVRYLKNYRDSQNKTKPLLRVQSIMSAVQNDDAEFRSAWEGVVDRINIIADEIRDFEDRSLEWDRYFVCAKPWQRLTISYNGRVHQCISDYSGKNVLGDASKESLFDIWHGEKAEAVRQAFRDHTYLEKNPACRNCSYGLKTKTEQIKVGEETMSVRKYEEVPPVVALDEVQKKTPVERQVSRVKKRALRTN
ncbi:MAG TPA: radical SAM protein [Xanthobacteraceae bacterium]|nr:radical SAM protein [Xanthobacteraceae bacterium]